MDENVAQQKNNFFKHLFSFKVLTAIALLSIFINIAYVEISSSLSPKLRVIERITEKIPFTKNQEDKLTNDICPQACVSQIYEATSSSQTQSTPTPTIIGTSLTPTLTPSTQNTAKEFFIPFGSGSSQAADWETISGIEATIDTNNFPALKTVTFEATVRIPNGNQTAYIRLYNATSKQALLDSEMSWEGGATRLLTSKPLNFPSGKNTYQIQIKTQLKSLTIFDQARLHIITE